MKFAKWFSLSPSNLRTNFPSGSNRDDSAMKPSVPWMTWPARNFCAEGIGLQPADLLHDRGRAEGVDDHLRVGGLARVFVAEPPADAEHRVSQAFQPHHPPADINVVDIVIPQLAVARIPVPVPVVMECRAREGDVGRGPHEEVVVDLPGHLVHPSGADAAAITVDDAPRERHVAELPGADELAGRGQGAVGAVLGPRLAEAAGLLRHLDDAPTLADVVADRFLDIDMLPGLHGPDRRQRMPMIRRRDGDGVHGLVVEDGAQVLDRLRPASLPFSTEAARSSASSRSGSQT